MPEYNGDPTRVSANFEVFPKDDYEFVIGEPKSFEKVGEKGLNYGIRYTLTVATEGPFKGKKFMQTLYMHSEGAQPINKRFILAGFGYDIKAEKKFDQDFAGKDWGFNPPTGACGDAWRELVGKRVVASLDVKISDRDGSDQQDVKGWRPI